MGLIENLTEIKRQKTEYIKPENIKEGVEVFGIAGVLQEGIDTSDATAESGDLIQGKTAYVNGEKIEGSIIPLYGTTETSVTISTKNVVYSNNIVVNEKYKILAALTSSSGNYYLTFYSINNDDTYTQLAKVQTYGRSENALAMSQDLVNNKIVVWLGHRNSNAGSRSLNCIIFDITTYEITQAGYSMSSNCWADVLVINPADPYVVSGIYNDSRYSTADPRIFNYDPDTNKIVAGSPGDRAMTQLDDSEWSQDGKYVIFYNSSRKPTTSNAYIYQYTKETKTLVSVRSVSAYKAVCLYKSNFMFTNLGVVNIVSGELAFPLSELNDAKYMWTWENVLFVHNGTDLYVYTVDDNYVLTLITVIKSVGSYTLQSDTYMYYSLSHPKSNRSPWFRLGNITYACKVEQGEYKIVKLTKDGTNYDLIPTIINNTARQDILDGKYFMTPTGLAKGTMPNNGTINITPSTEAQTIPVGYTSGGTVQAVTASIDANITPNNIKAGVTILGIEGNVEPDKPDQEKTVIPLIQDQEVFGDAGYELGKVTVKGVTSDIDENITAENIKEGITILGIEGTLKEGEMTPEDYNQALSLAESILGKAVLPARSINVAKNLEILNSLSVDNGKTYKITLPTEDLIDTDEVSEMVTNLIPYEGDYIGRGVTKGYINFKKNDTGITRALKLNTDSIVGQSPAQSILSFGLYSYFNKNAFDEVKKSNDNIMMTGMTWQGDGWYNMDWSADEMGMMFTLTKFEKITEDYIIDNMNINEIRTELTDDAKQLMARTIIIEEI